MTYSAGGLIQATDYNGFVSTTAGANINDIWAAGSGDKGYGQTAVGTVATAGTVTATQWASLVNTLSSLGSQTSTALTARTAPTAGTTIAILAAVNTDLTNVTTNRNNAVGVGTQYTGWTGTNSKTTATSSASGGWTITFTNTVTFADSNAARYFFNGGGVIYLANGKSSTGQTGDPPWNALAASCGYIVFSGAAASHTIAGTAYTGTTKLGGSGTPTTLSTATGYYALTPGAAATIIFKQFSPTAPYTTDYIQISVALNASSNILTFTTLWSANDTGGYLQAYADPISGGTAASGATPGTAPCCICFYYPPSSTYLTTASWGTPTVVATTT
jgi:hypothetical protein